ncbi:protein KHNYN [Embiotoca jacksoni]|uniref:protein KHNYN n=1 Tax=Embiotoca jacksoni TaxID=100190 RepID=UPI003703B129
MDSERSDGGGAEVEDEFACAGMLRGSLTSMHRTVERIFRVMFGIGADDLPQGNNGQIWLKLRGSETNVKAAKLFIKGVVNQEEQQEVSYPGVLHCVFCGARGLFMDCLIQSTSAHIVVGSPGFLLISGLAEPVVRAYSLITDLVERYEGTQSTHSENGERGLGESLDSRRAFKALVEKWEDRHILDLLVLPGSVKEILLDLVKESGLGSSPTDVNAGARSRGDSEDRWDKPNTRNQTLMDPFGTTDRWAEGMTAGAAKDIFFECLSTFADTRGKAEGAEERLVDSPQGVGEGEQLEKVATSHTKVTEGLREDEEQEVHLSMGNKEFWLLLKFFTAMGYTDDVVKRVLAQTGPKEASQILDFVQQEQDRSDREQRLQGVLDPKNQDGDAPSERERNRPCETEHKEDEGTAAGGDSVLSSNGEMGDDREGATGISRNFEAEGSAELKETGQEEDFVLGVLKKAAASCGYTEQNVDKVYNMFPDQSTRQLLLELQREGSREMDVFREGPREMDDVVLEKIGPKIRPVEARGEMDIFIPAEKKESGENGPVAGQDLFTWIHNQQKLASQYTSKPKQHQPSKSQTHHKVVLSEIKGPPMPTYVSSLDAPPTNFHSNKQQTIFSPNAATSKQNHQTEDRASNPKHQSSNSSKQPHLLNVANSSPTKAKKKQSSNVVVTGEQRFLEGLQAPFDLKLTDNPGDMTLRGIIIDGSNVAMSHGLGQFFSCRGIALAVQHFWDRGHRHISTLLPQWRQKGDHKSKERHYLAELQKLGLLSYTPSREVQGKRISSYDDRLILQLAQKTDGVIVTNDNLRDLLDESPVWRDIIKKRLLQYTFVGDHFMVPDDPLGRGGPHLDDFLRSDHRSPDPGNHSFAGLASTFPSSNQARSQTELLNFRDRTPGRALDASGEGGLGRGRRHGKGWDMEHQHGAKGPGLAVRVDRSLEETAGLREQLCQVFPGQDNVVMLVLQCHADETDINVLSGLILEQQKD